MNSPENKSQGKGFEGLHSLGSKAPAAEPPVNPEREADAHDLPAARGVAIQQPAQPKTSQSQTATSPWRGWLIALGVLVAGFFIWAANQSPSRTSYSPPTTNEYQPSPVVDTMPPAPPEPAITMPPVGNGLVLTSDQIRYCVYEERRMKGAQQAVDNYDQSSVNTFNAMVEDYNSRCGHFRYRAGTLAPIEGEAALIQAQLEREGRERITSAKSVYATTAADTAQAAADAAAAAADAAVAATDASSPVDAAAAAADAAAAAADAEAASADAYAEDSYAEEAADAEDAAAEKHGSE